MEIQLQYIYFSISISVKKSIKTPIDIFRWISNILFINNKKDI